MQFDRDDFIRQVRKLCQDERETDAEYLVKNTLAKFPDDLELITKLGEIQARLCKDLEAESTFRSVLLRNPNYEDAVCGLGRLLDQALRTEEAEQLYRDFIQSNKQGHCAVEDLCRLLLSEERTDEALELAREHVNQFENHSGAYDALRYVLHILEDQLESDLNDDRENEEIFNGLVTNLFEQLDVVVRLEQFSISGELHRQIEDDKIRLLSELENLFTSATSRNIVVSKDSHNRFSSYKE